MAKMIPLQKISTWLDFKRKFPQVPLKQKEMLVSFMKGEINFEPEDFYILADSSVHEESLLPEIEAKYGRSFTKWIHPPTTTCLECGSELTMCRDSVLKPTSCLVYEVDGPVLGAKITLRCRRHEDQIRYRSVFRS